MSRRNWYLITNSVVVVWVLLTLVAVAVHRFVDQPLWLLVHVPLLGAATAAILVWSQHFADTLLRRDPPGGRIGLGARLAIHTLGAGVVVAGVLNNSTSLVIAGASAVVAAIALHATILGIQLRAALPSRFAPLVRYYLAAASVFLVGIAAGVVMSALRDPVLSDRLVVVHLALNVYGWIGLTALGTLVLLWPTVLHARVNETADLAARRALPLLLVGLVVAGTGPLIPLRPLVAVGMALWITGALWLGREGWRQARAMPPATFAGWSLAAAYAWMIAAGGTLAVFSVIAPDWEGLRAGYIVALGPLVVGFAVQLLTGALSFLLPVVALGSPAAAKAGAEVLDRGGAFRVAVFNAGIIAYLLPMPSLVRVLLSGVVAGMVVWFVVLVARAIIVGRRVRRDEGADPDRSGTVRLTAPTTAVPAAPPRRTGSVTAAFAVIALCVAGGVAADPAAVGISTAASIENLTPTGNTTEVTVQVTGMRFTVPVIEVPYGDRLVVTFENTGTDVHDLTFANGVRTQRLAPGAIETVDVGVIGADLAGWCSIAGHRQMGMELAVVAIGAPASDQAHNQHGESAESGQADNGPSAADDVDLEHQPPASFRAWPARLAAAPNGTVHRITLRATEGVAEVAPGVRQMRWTFGGTAPGPVLRGRIGDTFEITLINDGTIGHSIDFHAGSLAPDVPMRTIQPGARLVYVFTATQAGIWMYHCATMPMSMHISNGLYGAVIIDPPDLAPVDREYLLIQSELYLGPQDGTADAEKLAAATPDLVSFNGYADQYVYRPLPARAGERIRIWMLDAGPNIASSFHVVGSQFDTVFAEGSYLLRASDPGGAQALGLQPAQGGFVEVVFPEAGSYPFLTHRMSDAERGARGVFYVEP